MSLLSRLQEVLGTWPVPIVVFLLLALGLGLVGSIRVRGRPRAAALLAAGGLLLAVAVTLGLTLRPVVPPHEAVRTLYLDPGEGIRAASHLHIVWGPVIDNVALFVPIGGIAAATFWRRRLPWIWLACVLLSIAIETVQYLAPIGRIANSADVLANAAGAALGIVVAVVSRARRSPRSRGRRGEPVTAA